jgi:predicted TIM-barrel fold metal-dependent hydrolase
MRQHGDDEVTGVPAGFEGQIVISTDGHAGADLRAYKPYLERRYHDEFEEWVASFRDPWGQLSHWNEEGDKVGFLSFAVPMNWDSAARLRLMDELGITAEVLFPNTAPPFFPSGALSVPAPQTATEYEYRFAGVRAHNRWLADFCADAGGRRAGVAQVFVSDLDDAIAEVRTAKEAGLMGVLLPADHMGGLVNLHEPVLDPLWAVCEELELPIHRHQILPAQPIQEAGPASLWVAALEVPFFARRAIAHLICSGVFTRFPKLLFATTELTESISLAGYLAELDRLYEVGRTVVEGGGRAEMMAMLARPAASLGRKPSEYFESNCFLGAPLDLKQSYLAGTPNLMFGADLPHSEGMGRFTREAVRTIVEQLAEPEVDDILYRRAATVYGFDLDHLQAVANQVGFSRDLVRTPLRDDERPRYPEETECFTFAPPGAVR